MKGVNRMYVKPVIERIEDSVISARICARCVN